MQYFVTVNGLAVHAEYDDSDIREIFLPLLRRWSERQRQAGKRLVVFLAAPPAAGKSTLAGFLEMLSRQENDLVPLQAVGMDGFHRRQDDLLSHTTVRDGKEIPLVEIKGAPITFDLPALRRHLELLHTQDVVLWPQYDRLLHNPVPDAIRADGEIILVEGNYLLLDLPGWSDLSVLADDTVSLQADPELLRRRLVARKIASGTAPKKAAAFVEFSDLANARLCLAHTKSAALRLQISENGRYTVIE